MAGPRRIARQPPVVNWLLVIAGAVGVVWILNDIFKAVLVPRAIDDERRISVWFARVSWHVWSRAAARLEPDRREEFLGLVAPFAFVMLVAIWLSFLVLFYGLILFGLRDQVSPHLHSLGDAIYFAGASVLTVGYGDFVGQGALARIVTLLAAASGIGTASVTIAFLFLVIGSFQQRERFIVVLDARAGAPASGLALLETYAQLGMLAELPDLFRNSQSWIADVLNSHLAYPILMAFRSSHRDESWVAALGALLDAAALLVTVVENVPAGEARLLLDVGMHLTHDLASYYILPDVEMPPADPATCAALRERLTKAGYRVRDDADAWTEFNALRASYGKPLEGISKRWFVST
ncbi:MAG TPA: potassium channel family protein, partial [Candidatus Eremiobacteraceae bacterium]|nr:potassium channel family protein [Candidatus Eremiobacteraceae bacterium]